MQERMKESMASSASLPQFAISHQQCLSQQKMHVLARLIARCAVRSLYTELMLYPKPGLVSALDSGSHRDMDASTFMRSLFALRHFFYQIALAGWRHAPFHALKQLGIQAEQRMLRATGGVNTHRGAIFCIGLLGAASARCIADQQVLTPQNLRASLREGWQLDLQQHQNQQVDLGGTSHGAQVAQKFAMSGAREEAAQGFPAIFELALPRLQQGLAVGCSQEQALIDSLFSLMAQIHDTNIVYRGGLTAAILVRKEAQHFLQQGGSRHPAWRANALQIHRKLVAENLSPGGAADLLAATSFIHFLLQSVAAS